jgi:SAM-dependent methyltransferase
MSILIIALVILSIFFCGVILFGAPYLPTLKPQVQAALELTGLVKGDTMLELGCGDGRVVLAAAKQGIKVVGYELNPLLALVAWLRTLRYRSEVKIVCGDFWRKDWPEADAVFVFLLDRYMEKLDNKLMQYSYKPIKLVSFAFQVPNKQPIKKLNGVFLYKYR